MPVEVQEVASPQGLRDFLALPSRLYREDRLYVPPHRPSLRKLLTPGESPFLEATEQRLFLARRDGKPVGRIGAFRDLAPAEEGWPLRFGFFECERDPEVARALFAAAASAFPGHGSASLVGPIHLSLHLECGLLVAGDGRPPRVMMTHNPPWYAELFAQAGLVPETDLLAYRLDRPQGLEAIAPILRRLRRRGVFTVRPLARRRYQEEMSGFGDLYNQSWSGNRGFVPLTAQGKQHLVAEFKPILDPSLVQVAELEGKAVGFSLALPDINPMLRAIDGLPTPLALLVALSMQIFRRPRAARVLALGLLPEHRGTGLGAWLVAETLAAAWKRGYEEVELSWVLEENRDVHSYLLKMGARVSRRYRLYRLPAAA